MPEAPVVTAGASRAPARSWREGLYRLREHGPLIGLLTVLAIGTVMAGPQKFWSAQTMSAISTVASTIAIVAVGVTLLMISGEFDLSVGQNFAFTPIVWTTLFVTHAIDVWLALVLALGCAVVVGLVNGRVTTYFRIPSFITTLGMLFVLQGLNNLLVSGHQLIAFEDRPLLTVLGARILGTPFFMPLAWMFAIAMLTWFGLTRLRFGNWTYATGGKAGPAKAMGVPTARVKRANFVICAFLAGLAGCMQFAYVRGITQGQGDNYELLAITAAVLGGTSLFGGTGTVWGSIIGAFLLATIQIGLVLVGAPGSFYVTFIGIILVIVVISNVRLGRFGRSEA